VLGILAAQAGLEATMWVLLLAPFALFVGTPARPVSEPRE
jgi:hypothetical protein